MELFKWPTSIYKFNINQIKLKSLELYGVRRFKKRISRFGPLNTPIWPEKGSKNDHFLAIYTGIYVLALEKWPNFDLFSVQTRVKSGQNLKFFLIR